MKKLLLLPVLFLMAACGKTGDLPRHLVCKTSLSEYDPNVKESYDVRIVEQNKDSIVLNVDGESVVLIKQLDKDGTVYYYSENPWYNFRIDDPNMQIKYSLGIPTNEPFARYTSCAEVE